MKLEEVATGPHWPRWNGGPLVVEVVPDFVDSEWVHGEVERGAVLIARRNLHAFDYVRQQSNQNHAHNLITKCPYRYHIMLIDESLFRTRDGQLS